MWMDDELLQPGAMGDDAKKKNKLWARTGGPMTFDFNSTYFDKEWGEKVFVCVYRKLVFFQRSLILRYIYLLPSWSNLQS